MLDFIDRMSAGIALSVDVWWYSENEETIRMKNDWIKWTDKQYEIDKWVHDGEKIESTNYTGDLNPINNVPIEILSYVAFVIRVAGSSGSRSVQNVTSCVIDYRTTGKW